MKPQRFSTTLLFAASFFFSRLGCAQTFTPQVLNKSPFLSVASLTQDYDGDGDLDIIATGWEPPGIYLLENDETKQFTPVPIITEDLTFYIADIDAADFDQDGDIDYLICFNDLSDGELAWFQRQDDGSYLKWTIATNMDFGMAEIADFNGDGWPDIAAVGYTTIDENEDGMVFLNQQNLFFEGTIVCTLCGEAVDAEDIDNDGDIDLAFGGSGLVGNPGTEDGGSRLLVNDGAGNFTLEKWIISYLDRHAFIVGDIKIVDLNRDGVKDILGIRGAGPLVLYFFDGANDFERVEIAEEWSKNVSGDFLVFDIDGNGWLDIVIQGWGDTYNQVSVFYQMAEMQFDLEVIELNWDRCCNPTSKMSFGDLDRDGDMDLIFPEQGNTDEDISWYENINGKLYRHQIAGRLDGIRTAKFGDWDGDGDLDIFATVESGFQGNTEDELVLFENLDGQNFLNWRLHDDLDGATDVELADIDGDGDLDAFATAWEADDLVWLRNDDFPADWVTDTIFPEANEPQGIAIGDVDQDGDVDVVMCSWNDNKVIGFKNDGKGNFSPFVVDARVNGPLEARIADLDGDGDQDIAVVSTESDNTVLVYVNDGSGSYIEQIIYSGASGRAIDVGDWDGDGDQDIFVGFYESDLEVAGFLAENGTFVQTNFTVASGNVTALKLFDLDKDQDLDLLTGFENPSTLQGTVLAASFNEDGAISTTRTLVENQKGQVTSIDVGDVNMDGQFDIVYADYEADNLVLLTQGCLALPSIDLGQDIVISDGQAVELNPMGEEGWIYEWSTGETTPTIVASKPAVYSVTVTNGFGCSSSDEIKVDITTTTNTSESNLFTRVNVFPNPTEEIILLTYTDMPEFFVELINAAGMSVAPKIRQKRTEGSGDLLIDISDVPTGSYFLIFKGEFPAFQKRIIKVK